jgi:hypothetical protein
VEMQLRSSREKMTGPQAVRQTVDP